MKYKHQGLELMLWLIYTVISTRCESTLVKQKTSLSLGNEPQIKHQQKNLFLAQHTHKIQISEVVQTLEVSVMCCHFKESREHHCYYPFN